MANTLTNKYLLIMSAVCCMALVLRAEAPAGTISGTVRDQAKAPVAGAVVTAANATDGTTRKTDSAVDGSYKLTDLAPGTYSV